MWAFWRRNYPRYTGVYMRGHIRPHHTIERDIPVPPRLIRRLKLQTNDRVAFDLSPRDGRPLRLVVYRRSV
jgi:hypothetical protein